MFANRAQVNERSICRTLGSCKCIGVLEVAVLVHMRFLADKIETITLSICSNSQGNQLF